jgi:acyl-coenzyme A thioesterase PaaI-like protein
MVAEWIPEPELEGFQGIVHGGIVSTVLDEAMSKVVAESGVKALTAELRIRFRQHVPSGKTICVRGGLTARTNA